MTNDDLEAYVEWLEKMLVLLIENPADHRLKRFVQDWHERHVPDVEIPILSRYA